MNDETPKIGPFPVCMVADCARRPVVRLGRDDCPACEWWELRGMAEVRVPRPVVRHDGWADR